MAILMRRGNDADFDASKMLPAEFAVSTDEKKVYIGFGGGEVVELATTANIENHEANTEAYMNRAEVASDTATTKASEADASARSAETSKRAVDTSVNEIKEAVDDMVLMAHESEETEDVNVVNADTLGNLYTADDITEIKENLTDLNANLTELIKVETISIPTTNVPAGSASSVSTLRVNCSKSGYKPIGVCGYDLINNRLVTRCVRIDRSTEEIVLVIRNLETSSTSMANAYVEVEYSKLLS